MLSWEIRSYRAAQELAGPVVFDRGVPDVAGYLTLIGLPVPPHIERAARTLRYSPRVFIAPHWPAIFTQDAQRKQSAQEAEAACRTMIDVYSGLGYELVPLPVASVADRVEFVRRVIG